MPKLASRTGDELAIHLFKQAHAMAFPGWQSFWYMITYLVGGWIVMLAVAVLPLKWWSATVVTTAVWTALFWRAVLLRKIRPALIAVLRGCGHCPACGYDLRASPERCPECGAAAALISSPDPAVQRRNAP